MLQSENQQRSEATRAAKLCQEDGAAFCACGFCSRALLGARRLEAFGLTCLIPRATVCASPKLCTNISLS